MPFWLEKLGLKNSGSWNETAELDVIIENC